MRKRDGEKERAGERNTGRSLTEAHEDGTFVLPPSAKRRRTQLVYRFPRAGNLQPWDTRAREGPRRFGESDFDEATWPRGGLQTRFTRNLT